MSDPDPATIWHHFRAELRRAVNDTTWHIWLEGVSLRGVEGTTLRLDAPDEARDYLRTRFARLLSACAQTVLGPGARVEVAGGPEDSPPAPSHRAPELQGLNPKYTFDQFVIGDSNRVAHGAALAVAEMPGLAYNPLFICGPPGLGKTHLLHSIGAYVAEHNDNLAVRYTTGETFTDQFVAAVKLGGIEAFKAAYRGVNVLLVDDVQFLQSKAKTEQEFFHTFDALHQAGAQLVLTSDRLPTNMNALADRLRERFASGLVCEVRPGNRGTRMTILRKRVLQDDLAEVDSAALELIAERVTTSIRALEGALIRVVAFGSLTGRPVTAQLAAEVLAGLYPELAPRTYTVRDVQEQACAVFAISMEELLSSSRSQPVAFVRQAAMYVTRELTGATLPAIGRAFGNRNHTTVLHACRRVAERMAEDRDAYEAVQRLTQALGARRSGPVLLTDFDSSSTAPGGAPAKRAGVVHRTNTSDED